MTKEKSKKKVVWRAFEFIPVSFEVHHIYAINTTIDTVDINIHKTLPNPNAQNIAYVNTVQRQIFFR